MDATIKLRINETREVEVYDLVGFKNTRWYKEALEDFDDYVKELIEYPVNELPDEVRDKKVDCLFLLNLHDNFNEFTYNEVQILDVKESLGYTVELRKVIYDWE